MERAAASGTGQSIRCVLNLQNSAKLIITSKIKIATAITKRIAVAISTKAFRKSIPAKPTSRQNDSAK
jgi:hypothetical protein